MASNNPGVSVTRWPQSSLPNEADVQRKLRDEGLSAYGWGQRPWRRLCRPFALI